MQDLPDPEPEAGHAAALPVRAAAERTFHLAHPPRWPALVPVTAASLHRTRAQARAGAAPGAGPRGIASLRCSGLPLIEPLISVFSRSYTPPSMDAHTRDANVHGMQDKVLQVLQQASIEGSDALHVTPTLAEYRADIRAAEARSHRFAQQSSPDRHSSTNAEHSDCSTVSCGVQLASGARVNLIWAGDGNAASAIDQLFAELPASASSSGSSGRGGCRSSSSTSTDGALMLPAHAGGSADDAIVRSLSMRDMARDEGAQHMGSPCSAVVQLAAPPATVSLRAHQPVSDHGVPNTVYSVTELVAMM